MVYVVLSTVNYILITSALVFDTFFEMRAYEFLVFNSGYPKRRGETIRSLVPHLVGVCVGIFIGVTFMKVRTIRRHRLNFLLRCDRLKIFVIHILQRMS